VALSFAPREVVLQPDGHVRLLHPGIAKTAVEPPASALAYLQTLPLDEEARKLLASADDLQSIAPARRASLGQASIGRGGAAVVEETYPDESALVCSACNAALTPGEPFCGTCGQRVGRRSEPTCPRCRAAVASDDTFCGSCGQRLARGTASVCSRCKSALSAGDAFCGSCGQRVGV
jgi:hypothetical protein